MLVKVCTPRAPILMARSASTMEKSTSCIDTAATKAGNRSGCLAHNSAIESFATRAKVFATSPSATSSIGGLGSEMICR